MGVCGNGVITSFQFHAVSRIYQGRQREPRVKTLACLLCFSLNFQDMWSSGLDWTYHRALPLYHTK